ncbi:UNVERIFIED_CONTAM: hypothetical protein NCL1_41264 [Trichonephila clavipes]
MNQLPIQILVVSVLAVSSVIAIKGYDNDFVNFNYRSDKCISTSGDQSLCDELQSCIQKLPITLLNNFNECVSQIYPDGMLGKCNDQENLFGTMEQLNQYFHCFLTKLPQKSSLSPAEHRQFDHPYKVKFGLKLKYELFYCEIKYSTNIS